MHLNYFIFRNLIYLVRKLRIHTNQTHNLKYKKLNVMN